MKTRSVLSCSLALLLCSLPFACSSVDGDSEDVGEANEELVSDNGAWTNDDDRGSSEAEYKGAIDSLSVQGNAVRANGKRFVSRGVIFEGLLYTERDIKKCVAEDYNGDNEDHKFCQRHLLARDYYEGKGTFAGHDALTLAITNWHANTVRFNLNQSALDPGSPGHDPDYITEIAKFTNMARNRGLVVILAPFSGRNDNAPDKLMTKFPDSAMPNGATMGAIEVLSKRFGDDTGIVIDLFNEPYGAWPNYINGGNGFTGVNALLNRMRALGAKNVAIVQGLGADWSNYPGGISDGKLVFSGHPFLPNHDNQLDGEHIDWYSRFGEIAKSKPFWITAWNASAGDKWCAKFGIGLATEFVQYVQKHDIGMVGFAFDSPYSMTRDFRTRFDEPTKIGTACSDSASAQTGDVLQQSFLGTLPALKNSPPKGGQVSISKNQKVGKPITIDIDAKDPEHDPISYSARVEGDNAGPRQHASKFHFTFSSPGTKKIIVNIADNKGAMSHKTVTLHVTK